MNSQYAALAVLLVLAASSAWILHDLEPELLSGEDPPVQVPDFFLENFVTTIRDEQGRPTQRIEAVHMAYFPETGTRELTWPRLTMYRDDATPWQARSERGWLSASGDVMLLQGEVLIWRNDRDGDPRIEISTRDLRVLPETDYGETDQPVVVTTRHSRSRGVGMRAWLEKGRLELRSQVHTVFDRDALLL